MIRLIEEWKFNWQQLDYIYMHIALTYERSSFLCRKNTMIVSQIAEQKRCISDVMHLCDNTVA